MKRVWFSAFRRVVPEDYENWLEDMASKGWHVDRIGQWSSILMTFRKGEPKKIRFVYDMQAAPKKDYIESYEQFGWEFVGQMASCFIWKMPYEAERPEAFTDKESLRDRTNRVLKAVSVSFIIAIAGILGMFVPQLFFPETLTSSDRVQLIIAQIVFLLMALALGGVMMNIKKSSDK